MGGRTASRAHSAAAFELFSTAAGAGIVASRRCRLGGEPIAVPQPAHDVGGRPAGSPFRCLGMDRREWCARTERAGEGPDVGPPALWAAKGRAAAPAEDLRKSRREVGSHGFRSMRCDCPRLLLLPLVAAVAASIAGNGRPLCSWCLQVAATGVLKKKCTKRLHYGPDRL